MIFLNVMATTLLTRHFGRLMAERGKGGILLVSSILGVAPGPFFACYAATKAYVATLGESLCAEMAPLGVDVSVLVPALTKTNMSKAFVSAGAPADSPGALHFASGVRPHAFVRDASGACIPPAHRLPHVQSELIMCTSLCQGWPLPPCLHVGTLHACLISIARASALHPPDS